MAFANPFEWLSPVAQKRAFAVFCVLGLIVQYAWSVLDAPLKNEVAPKGMLSFEVAGTLAKAQSIVASWNHPAQVSAAANLGLDCLFLVVYGGTIALGCVLVMRALSNWRLFAGLGLLLSWAQVVAMLCDAIENYSLIRILLGAQESWLPVLALYCARPKSILYAAGMFYALIGFALIVLRKIFRRGPQGG
jgi:hypothetical protein